MRHFRCFLDTYVRLVICSMLCTINQAVIYDMKHSCASNELYFSQCLDFSRTYVFMLSAKCYVLF